MEEPPKITELISLEFSIMVCSILIPIRICIVKNEPGSYQIWKNLDIYAIFKILSAIYNDFPGSVSEKLITDPDPTYRSKSVL